MTEREGDQGGWVSEGELGEGEGEGVRVRVRMRDTVRVRERVIKVNSEF